MRSINILSLEEARVFDPKEKTCIIRILGPDYVERDCGGNFPGLLHAARFMRIFCYEFDDVTLQSKETHYPHAELFEEYHATKILNSFEKVRDLTDHLVVHCFQGISRSSAVAAALNHIFDLKVSDETFLSLEKHSPNMHVYNTLIQTAKDMGKVFPFWKSGENYFL